MKLQTVLSVLVILVIVLGVVACGGGDSDDTTSSDQPAAEQPAAEEPAAEEPAAEQPAAEEPAAEEPAEPAESDASAPALGDPQGALDGADSYSLLINAMGTETTFEVIRSKQQFHVVASVQGVDQEMFIMEDKLYVLSAGTCIAVDVGPQMSALEQLGDITMYTSGLAGEKFMGEEEVNGIKTNHFQTTSGGASVDIWVAQEGNYVVRLVTEAQGQKVEINVTNINALDSIELPEACASAIDMGTIEIPEGGEIPEVPSLP